MEMLLDRIGLAAMPAPDVDGLRELHRAYVGSVPYEDLAVQLGERVTGMPPLVQFQLPA